MSAPARTQSWAYRTDGSRQKKSTAWRLILVIGMLFTGSINTLSKKAQNSSSSVGLHGEHEKEFKKPWFQTLVMFSGEATVILFWLLSEHVARSRSREMQINETEAQTLIRTASEDPVAEVPTSRLKAFFILGIPACFDLLGTTLAGIGLIYVDASVWQMLRGSIIVFSSVLSVIFLKRKLHGFHWFGVLVCTVGLGAVGTSQLLKGSSSSNLVLGLILIVAGQFVSASQMILEEALLSKRGLKPAQVVGGEGCWGVLLMSCLVLPILYNVHGDDHGSYENALDAITLIGNNKFLLAMVLLYWSSISFYNFFGLSVTKELTAVHRTLIDACRTTVVWVVEIFIYYVAGSHKFGEEWTVYSFLQLGGFALLIFGTMVYNKLIRLPCFFYPGLEYLPVPAEREEEEEASVYPPLGEAVDGIEGRTSLTKAAKV